MADIQIISSRRFLFQDTEYVDEVIDGNKTGRKVHNVKRSIIVAADLRPQVVPEWVKNDELFDIAVDDGVIIEVSVSSKAIKPKGQLKGITAGQTTPEAAIVGTEDGTGAADSTKEADATGWTGAGKQ